MALNFNQFSLNQPSSNRVGKVLSAVAEGMPTASEKSSLIVDDYIGKQLGTLRTLAGAGVAGIPMVNETIGTERIPNAMEAWIEFNKEKSDKERIALKRAGITAVTFAEMFNMQKSAYLNSVVNNIKNYQGMNKVTNSDMRKLFANNQNVASFLNTNVQDPELSPLLTPKRTMSDQWKDLRFMPGADQTFGEAAGTLATDAAIAAPAYAVGKRLVTGKWPGMPGFGGGGAPASPTSTPLSPAIGGPSKTTIMQKARNIGNSIKGKGGKLTMESAKNWLKSRIGSKGLVNVLMKSPKTPYTLLAAGLAYGLYSAVKNKDKYQGSLDQRMEDTYGGGPVDTSGAAGIEAARQKMAAYNAKYGR